MAATSATPSTSPAFSHRVVVVRLAAHTIVPASTAGASQFGSTERLVALYTKNAARNVATAATTNTLVAAARRKPRATAQTMKTKRIGETRPSWPPARLSSRLTTVLWPLGTSP